MNTYLVILEVPYEGITVRGAFLNLELAEARARKLARLCTDNSYLVRVETWEEGGEASAVSSSID